MKFRNYFFFYIIMFFVSTGNSQSKCAVQNTAFQVGEELNYKVIYNWGLIWLESAYCDFKVNDTVYQGRQCYAFTGSGGTYPKYDWFYKVRDNFETLVDTETFRPLKFKADMYEGHKQDKHLYLFNNKSRKAFTFINRGAKPVEIDTVNIGTCSIDVLSAIYYARNIDYSKCKIRDTISISMLLDGKLYAIYIRYLGKETFTSKELGTFKCIKFSPLLVDGTIFKAGESMVVWVSDDKNKLPIYIETPISVGTIKVKLMSFKGLRHNLEARVK